MSIASISGSVVSEGPAKTKISIEHDFWVVSFGFLEENISVFFRCAAFRKNISSKDFLFYWDEVFVLGRRYIFILEVEKPALSNALEVAGLKQIIIFWCAVDGHTSTWEIIATVKATKLRGLLSK